MARKSSGSIGTETILGIVAFLFGAAWLWNKYKAGQGEGETISVAGAGVGGATTPGPYTGTSMDASQKVGGQYTPYSAVLNLQGATLTPTDIAGAGVGGATTPGPYTGTSMDASQKVGGQYTPYSAVLNLQGATLTPTDIAAAGGQRVVYAGVGIPNVTAENLISGQVRAVYTTPEVAAAAPVPASLDIRDIAAANTGAKAGALDAYGNPTNYDKSGIPVAGAAPIVPVLPGFDQYGHAIPGVVAPTNNTGYSQGVSGWPSGIPVITPSAAKQAPAGAVYVRTDGGYSPALQDIMNSQ
jgi:hypothetical protein